MNRLLAVAFLFTGARFGAGEVQPLADAPAVLRLSSGAEVKVMDMFKTTFVETNEPALVLRYPTSKIKDDLCSEAEEVWAEFRPIVEKEKVRAAVIFQARLDPGTGNSTGGYTWIWKQDEHGVWDTLKEGDKGRTVNGLDSSDSTISGAQTIPLRDPRPGESRPAWWLSCWAGNIVVIKGVLRFDLHDPPDLEMKLSEKALATHFSKESHRSLAEAVSRYLIGTMTVDKMLYASPGIDLLNTRIAAMRSGEVKSVKVLVMAMQSPGRPPFFFNVQPGVDTFSCA